MHPYDGLRYYGYHRSSRTNERRFSFKKWEINCFFFNSILFLLVLAEDFPGNPHKKILHSRYIFLVIYFFIIYTISHFECNDKSFITTFMNPFDLWCVFGIRIVCKKSAYLRCTQNEEQCQEPSTSIEDTQIGLAAVDRIFNEQNDI